MRYLFLTVAFLFIVISCNNNKNDMSKKQTNQSQLKKKNKPKNGTNHAVISSAKKEKNNKVTQIKTKQKVASVGKIKVSPASPTDPVEVFKQLKSLAQSGDISKMRVYFTKNTNRVIKLLKPRDAKLLFAGKIAGKKLNGGRAVLKLKGNKRLNQVVFFLRDNVWKFDVQVTFRYHEPKAGEKNPLNKPISLKKALASISGTGNNVYAKIITKFGNINCRLFPDAAPYTVANFVGLAKGLRGFKDPKTKKWTKKPFYSGLIFHRVIPRFMIQGGDPLGAGTGGPGFAFKDELNLKYRFDKPGMLAMANSGPNTNGSQFFITEVPTPWLNDNHTIFGMCKEIDVIKNIARKGKGSKIKAIEFYKK